MLVTVMRNKLAEEIKKKEILAWKIEGQQYTNPQS